MSKLLKCLILFTKILNFSGVSHYCYYCSFLYNISIIDLLAKVDPVKFQETFGTDMSQVQTLIEAKTLTISKLMTIMPPGTIDPSPFIYNNTMYTMAGLVSVGAALHLMVKPVDGKYFEKST